MKLEQKIKNLNELVQELEGENVDLDLAIKNYKKASGLAKEILDYLKETENKIKLIKQENDNEI